MKLSLIIPVKNVDDRKLKELLKSIEVQNFPKEQLEILIITEGTSESAKAIGIRRAKGEVIGILASDNELTNNRFLMDHYLETLEHGGSQPSYYEIKSDDNCLNRYFALIGGNDPLSFYMNKNDRTPHYKKHNHVNVRGKSTGDNGYFTMAKYIRGTDLDNYYHIDNSYETGSNIYSTSHSIWHKTGGNIFSFFAKRYRYGLQHAFNKNRRWHLVDFRKPKDIWRLIWFILASLTIIEPLILSVRGYLKIKDKAWFLHPVVCVMTVMTYTVLVIHLGLQSLYQSLFVPTDAQKA